MIERIGPGELMSQATVWNGTVFLSGQVALDNRDGDFETQAHEIFARIGSLLEEAGSDKSRLLAATVWLADLEDFPVFNRLWRRWLGDAERPARATIRADLALPGLRLEVQVTAATK